MQKNNFKYNSFKLKTFFIFTEISKNMGRLCFPLNGNFEKSGSVGRWETKQFIGMA